MERLFESKDRRNSSFQRIQRKEVITERHVPQSENRNILQLDQLSKCVGQACVYVVRCKFSCMGRSCGQLVLSRSMWRSPSIEINSPCASSRLFICSLLSPWHAMYVQQTTAVVSATINIDDKRCKSSHLTLPRLRLHVCLFFFALTTNTPLLFWIDCDHLSISLLYKVRLSSFAVACLRATITANNKKVLANGKE